MAATMTAHGQAPVLKRGDAYRIPVKLFFNDEEITDTELALLEGVEFTLGDLAPVLLAAREAWSDTLRAFLLPVTQEQTFALDAGRAELDVRAKFLGGDVLGIRHKISVRVVDALSGEVL